MLHSTIRAIALLVTIGGLAAALAVSPAIGIATANGNFQVDRSTVQGNATLFPGTVVETGKVGSVLRMGDGARLRLGSLSRGRVFQERLVLEQGEGLIEQAGRYRVEAGDLQIVPSSAAVAARIALDDNRRVSVAVASGDLRVLAADGTLLARVHSGRSLEFDPQASGAAPPFTVTGCLVAAEGRYYLKDDTASVTFELTGAGLGANAGQRVEVSGTEAPAGDPGATQRIRVIQIKRLPGGCVTPATRATGNSGASGKGKTTKAIIAGVAIAGAVTGTTVGLIGEDKAEAPKPPISR